MLTARFSAQMLTFSTNSVAPGTKTANYAAAVQVVVDRAQLTQGG